MVIRTAMVVAYKNHAIFKHVHYYYDYCPNIHVLNCSGKKMNIVYKVMTLLINISLISINNPTSIFWEIILCICRYNNSSAAQDIHTRIPRILMAKAGYGNQHVNRFLCSNLDGVSVSQYI